MEMKKCVQQVNRLSKMWEKSIDDSSHHDRNVVCVIKDMTMKIKKKITSQKKLWDVKKLWTILISFLWLPLLYFFVCAFFNLQRKSHSSSVFFCVYIFSIFHHATHHWSIYRALQKVADRHIIYNYNIESWSLDIIGSQFELLQESSWVEKKYNDEEEWMNGSEKKRDVNVITRMNEHHGYHH
jgi:hypothetical protein